MKIKDFNEFLFEWGYGGEGGVASRDPIKMKDRMFAEIDMEDIEEEEEDVDIPILSDINESKSDVDPWGEEDWAETDYSYKNWKSKGGNIYDFLKQLNNPTIIECLERIKSLSYKKADGYIEDILDTINGIGISSDESYAVEYDIDNLKELSIDYDDEEEKERDPDEEMELRRDRERD